jgi:class 3 adenylate cyclase/tetratricopeptide (TPR) repeat protein
MLGRGEKAMRQGHPRNHGHLEELRREGERRHVTVLFADLVGFTAYSERAGEEAAYGLMQHLAKLLRNEIEVCGGSVRGFTGDGVMALFGVPQAQEDAPLNACQAALSIQRRIAEESQSIEARYGLRPELRIGINTGLAIVGQVEHGEDASATALGDAVNLASRLQELCPPGSVVVSETTQRLVEGRVESHFDGERRIRGKTDPQSIFRLESIRAGTGRFDTSLRRGLTTFVGRNVELEVLDKSFARAQNAARACDVAGDPGIGKSRLLFEFRKRIKSRAFILSGSCSHDGQRTPFLPFIEVVRGAFRIQSDDDETAVAAKLSEGLTAVGLYSTQNLGLLINLFGLRPPTRSLEGLDAALVGLRTRDLLIHLLKARCQLSSVVMILEDLHWIDKASEELLANIIDDSRLSLLIIYSRRPEYRPRWLYQANVDRLQLEPLSAEDTVVIVKARLGAAQVPTALLQIVAERSEGNALFAEEIASFMLEHAMASRQGGLQFDASQLARALPISIQSLISARIDRLSIADRGLLQAASVIGRQFAPDLLASIVPAVGSIDARLATLEALDLVHYHARSSNYLFKHALVRDVLYNSLLRPQLTSLHSAIADEIERRSQNRLLDVAELLADHYLAAGCADKAFRYLAMAGRKSLNAYSIEEAQQHFRRALALVEAPEVAKNQDAIADAIVGLLEALFLKGDMPETKSVAEFYLPTLEATERPSPQLAFALYFLGSAVQNTYDFKAADRIATKALEIAEHCGDIRAIAYARMLSFNCSTVLGRLTLEESERTGLQVLHESQQARDNYVLNWSYFCIAWDYGVRGLMQEAQDWATRLLEGGKERGDRRAVGFAHLTMAWLAILDGRYNDALADAEICEHVAVTQFDRIYGAAATATATILAGKSVEGLNQLLKLRRSTVESGLNYAASGMHGAAGVGLIMAGRMAEGIRIIRRSIDDADANGDCGVGFWNRIILAEVYLELLTSTQRPPLLFLLRNLGSIVRARLYGKRRALRLLEQASRFKQLHERGVIRARINTDLGLLYKLKGQPAVARQFLEKGRVPAEQQGATFVLNKIQAILADLN